MFTLAPPPWFRTYMRPSLERKYPGIFLYMKDPAVWSGYEALTDLIRVCTPNKSLKQQFTETVDGFKKEILENSKERLLSVKASLTWSEGFQGQFFLRICESIRRPEVTYVLVLEFTPEGNLERIVRMFTLTASTHPSKKG